MVTWLTKELEKRGFEVVAPQLPDPNKPRIYNWVSKLAEVTGRVDQNTYFVGHSMGCQTIARFLEKLPSDQKAGGVIFVAGFFKRLTGLEDDLEVQETDRHWLTAPINLPKVKEHMEKSVAIFSTDDPWIPSDNQNDFRDKLGSEIIVVKNMQHLGDSFKKVPIILEKILEIAK